MGQIGFSGEALGREVSVGWHPCWFGSAREGEDILDGSEEAAITGVLRLQRTRHFSFHENVDPNRLRSAAQKNFNEENVSK